MVPHEMSAGGTGANIVPCFQQTFAIIYLAEKLQPVMQYKLKFSVRQVQTPNRR
jgi:hypothetical protein